MRWARGWGEGLHWTLTEQRRCLAKVRDFPIVGHLGEDRPQCLFGRAYRRLIATPAPETQEADGGAQFEGPRLLAAGHLKGTGQLRLDLLVWSVEGGKEFGAQPAHLRFPQRRGLPAQRLVGHGKTEAVLAARYAGLKEPTHHGGADAGRMLKFARVVQCALDAGDTGRSAIDDVEVAGNGFGGDPCLRGSILSQVCLPLRGVSAHKLHIAHVEGQQGGEDERGLLTVGVPNLVGQREGRIASAGGSVSDRPRNQSVLPRRLRQTTFGSSP